MSLISIIEQNQSKDTAIMLHCKKVSYKLLNRLLNIYSKTIDITPGSRVVFSDSNDAHYLVAILLADKHNFTIVPVSNGLPELFVEKIAHLSNADAVVKSIDELTKTTITSSNGDISEHVILFTSGSTSDPKGVIHTKDSWLTAAKTVAKTFELNNKDKIINFVPMPFVGNLLLLSFPTLITGGTLRLEKFTPYIFPKIIKEYNPNKGLLVPAMINLMQHQDYWETLDLSGFDFIGVGSTVVPETIPKALFEKGLSLFRHVFASTECIGMLNYDIKREEFDEDIPLVLGKPQGDYEIKLSTENELMIKGPAMFKGYVNQSTNNESQWFVSDDIVSEKNNNLYFQGRKSDIFKINGVNVSPVMTEKMILKLHNVKECTTIKLLNKTKLEELGCVCVGDNLSKLIILNHCRNNLPDFQVPRKIWFAKELPKNTMHKVDKQKLLDFINQGEFIGYED